MFKIYIKAYQYIFVKIMLDYISIISMISTCLVGLLRSYRGADKSLLRPTSRCILFGGENISFDTSLVIYINSTNIPPIMIINRIYEHQIFCRGSLFPFWSG